MRKGSHQTKKARLKISRNHADVSGINNPMYGKHHIGESKEKNRLAHLGKSSGMKGKYQTKEAKEKIRSAQLGKNNFWYGKHFSKEYREKLSETHLGQTPWNKGKTGIYSKNIIEKMRVAHLGKQLSEAQKRKIGLAQSGEKSYNWKGGITSLTVKIRSNFKYHQWRSDIFTRDNFTCQDCGQKGVYLEAHHEKSFSSILQKYEITTIEEALNCEELWNINNGVTLCEDCHKKIHKEIISEKVT